jgi:serine/threonine protein kinase/formylglycine-generating enzyme required for sulfatase activity
MSPRESADERFVRALAEAASYRARRRSGAVEGLEAWLHAHEDLRELLEPMVEEGALMPLTSSGPIDGLAAANGAPGARRFAHFQILGSLGGGGMGDVYLALDEKLGRRVALKLIRPEALWSHDARLRFHRETLAIGRLDHPNICKLYEAGEHAGQPFMALQYIEGETLALRLERTRAVRRSRGTGSAPSTRADITASVALIEQVARALHHAHEYGLVHRDIKPGNIMLCTEVALASEGGQGKADQPIVLDFGLVRDERNLEASLSSSRRGLGTPLYMSPEQIQRTGRVDARSDVYSLGVVLYECSTHTRPFDATTEAELAEKVLANRYEHPCRLNRQLPPELGLVIACALDRDPERRYRTALAFAEDLRRVIDRQPVAARPIGALLRSRRFAQRNPTLIAVGALASVAVCGLGLSVRSALEARNQKVIATMHADEASESLDRFHLLSDIVKLEEAQALEPTLYPALPEQASAMRAWLRERGQPLADRLPILEAALVELRRKAQQSSPLGAGHPDAAAVAATYVFEEAADRFLHQALIELIDDLCAFVGQGGELSAVQLRLVEAESAYQMTVEDHKSEWDVAIAAIARSDDVVASQLYGHFVLPPQVGLVPIGMDPESKLWEFAHVASGSPARREPDQSRLAIAMDTGIVFVLLPRGTFWMGAQSEDPSGQNYDPSARLGEAPVRTVSLATFFLSKYELTQGQWHLLTDGEVPSHFTAGASFRGQEITLRNPVEGVDFSSCTELLQRQGLLLPTEAQWEYGCRAGSTTPWWTGSERESLCAPRLAANLADQSALRIEMVHEPIEWPQLDDGFGVHAPVGSFAANGFGLHDTHGNVLEWCNDTLTGRALWTSEAVAHPIRGGDFQRGPGEARSARRDIAGAFAEVSVLGLRPARRVTP